MLHLLKHLIPRNHRSHYLDSKGRPHFVVWKQWLNHCYKVEDFVVVSRPDILKMYADAGLKVGT